MLTDRSALVDAFAQTWESTLDVCRQLDGAEWARPTGCAGWTVKDNVSHLVGLERVMMGDAHPDDHVLPDDLPHVTSDSGRYMEVHVDIRRPLDPAVVLKEFEETGRARIAALRSMDDDAFAADGPGPLGRRVALGRFLPIRVFDVYAHGQDIRRATGRAGELDDAAAAHSRDMILARLGAIANEAGLAARIAITGPGAATTVDLGGATVPAATITTGFANFIALGCGRADAQTGAPAVTVEGDSAVADQLLERFAITP